MSEPVADNLLADPFGFARAASFSSGQLGIAAMPRLQDRLPGSEDVVSYTVRGGQDQYQRALLDVQISGSLNLLCGRCLAPLEYALALKTKVLLLQPGAAPQTDDDPEAPEWIEVAAGQELDLLELVEDEILLGLPLAVRHDPENCRNGKSGADQGMKADTPFASLATLLKPRRTGKQ